LSSDLSLNLKIENLRLNLKLILKMYFYGLDLIEYLQPNKSKQSLDNWHSFIPKHGKYHYILFNSNYKFVTVVYFEDGDITLENLYREDIDINLKNIINNLEYGLISEHSITGLNFLPNKVDLIDFLIII